MRWLVCVLVACSAPSAPSPAAGTSKPAAAKRGGTIPIVDSHVHLTYYPVAQQLAEHGVGAAVDLACPERALGTKYPLPVIQAGPMLTRPGGYPLDSWGADGYGIGCADRDCLLTAIDRFAKKGARVIKIALDDNGLDPTLAQFATRRAHALGLKVAVHALSDASARKAAEIDADVLAHTPLELLAQKTIDAWATPKGKRAVISTLAAFGGTDEAIDNLRRFHDAGVTILYGTDLGNLRVDGPSQDEIAMMRSAGMTSDEITAAMTTVPWRFWGFGATRSDLTSDRE